MRKSPEEYFREQDFSIQPDQSSDFTPAERAFMEKYMGADSARLLEQLGIAPPVEPGPRLQSLRVRVSEVKFPAGGDQGGQEPDAAPNEATSVEPVSAEVVSGEAAAAEVTPEGVASAEPTSEEIEPSETAPEETSSEEIASADTASESATPEGEASDTVAAIAAEGAALEEDTVGEVQAVVSEEKVAEAGVPAEASAGDAVTALEESTAPELASEAIPEAVSEAATKAAPGEEAKPLAADVAEMKTEDSTTAPEYAPSEFEEPILKEDFLEESLKNEAEIQMVGFFIGGQEFTIPTVSVQEVIRHMPVAKLPAAPDFVAGVINLRGRVTPLIELRDILEVRSPRQGEDKFIIICRRQGLQVGMIIEKVHTMYRIPQSEIEWGIETHLGINADYVAGLFKQGEYLVSIVSVDRIIAGILK